MAVIPFGEWLPDLPAHGNLGLVTCLNAIPRTPQSYGPVAGLAVYSSALTARCQGAYAALDTAGNIIQFAADAAKLYTLDVSSTTWNDASKVGGYAVPSDHNVQFVQFGSRIVAAMGLSDPVQSYVIGTSTDFADLAAAAPRAKYAAVVREFVMLAHTYDAADGTRAQRVWWHAINDPTSWPTPGSAASAAVQSDFQDLLGDGGWIQGIVGGLGTADVVIFQERATWRGIYTGDERIFHFDLVEGARGCPAPGSIAQLGAIVFYLGEDGFYMFDGTNSKPIGANKVDKTFFSNLDQTYFFRISAAVDPINKLVHWAYPTAGSGGNPARLLTYNWTLDRWSLSEVTCEYLFRSLSFGHTLETLDTVSASIDALPITLDSRAWTGGRLLLSAFDTSHRLNYFTGANLAATFETGDLDLADGRRAFVTGIRPVADGGTVTAKTGYRNSQDAAVSYTTATSAAADAFCPQRISARFARAHVAIAAAGSWTHAKGFEPRYKPEGLR